MSHSETLELIKREFSTREEVIERAFHSSKSFRALCREYRDCAKAWAWWRQAESREAELREAEYAELLRQLTGEIEARLQAVGSIADARSDAKRHAGPED